MAHKRKKTYRIPIKKFLDKDQEPKRGQEVTLKTRLGKKVDTEIVKVYRSEVLLQKKDQNKK